jgi:PadR family transcriptional regulator PadR
MPTGSTGILPGTLDLLILKALSLGRLHGYGVLLRVQQMTQGELTVEQGALYPALYRLERQALLDTEWSISDRNRKAKFYRLTPAGRKRLREETEGWNRMVGIMGAALKTRSGEIS